MNQIQVFYTPAVDGCYPQIIDEVQADGTGLFCHLTLEQLRARYPLAKLGSYSDVMATKESMMRTEPVRCTEDQFNDALECLPPLGWQCKGGGESFKMVERLSGRMTTIYARTGATYWSFVDLDTMTHSEIMAKVMAAIKGSEQQHA